MNCLPPHSVVILMTHRIIIVTNDTNLTCCKQKLQRCDTDTHTSMNSEAAVAVVLIKLKYVELRSCWIFAESRRERDDDGGSSYNSR